MWPHSVRVLSASAFPDDLCNSALEPVRVVGDWLFAQWRFRLPHFDPLQLGECAAREAHQRDDQQQS